MTINFKRYLGNPLEAEKIEQINKANGEAAAMVAIADARATSLAKVAHALKVGDGKNAASLSLAEQYVAAFNRLAKTNNTLILPANAGDVTSLVGQAMSIYKTISGERSGFELDKETVLSADCGIQQSTLDPKNPIPISSTEMLEAAIKSKLEDAKNPLKLDTTKGDKSKDDE